jgi:ribosomal protein S18 acetylase RimI-like enzyme
MMKPFISQNGRYTITTDPEKLDVETVCALLHDTYWAKTRPSDIIVRSLEHSLCFSLFDLTRQIGLARVVTDYATHAYLCDVVIAPEYRGKDLGTWLIACVLKHPDLAGLRRISLLTSSAQSFYKRFGFQNLDHPENYMELFNG